MPAGHTVCDNTLGDTCCHSTLDDGGYRIHRSNNLGLELWWNMQLNLLKQILRRAESADDQNVLIAISTL